MCGGWCRKIYLFVAAWTFLFQVRDRLLTCDGLMACTVSLFKGAVWSFAWPFYWINYETNFTLLHPFVHLPAR
jgi:hypothetical protein